MALKDCLGNRVDLHQLWKHRGRLKPSLATATLAIWNGKLSSFSCKGKAYNAMAQLMPCLQKASGSILGSAH